MAKIRKRGNSYQIDYFDPNGKRVRDSSKKKKVAEAQLSGFIGGPYRNRTCNLLIKSQLLCLVELTARIRCICRWMIIT